MPESAVRSLAGTGGVQVSYRAWEVAEPVGIVLCVHGLGEHAGRYGGLARALEPLNLSLFAVDMRGHGRSQGKRGHVSELSDLLRDLDRLRHRAGAEDPDRPLFLIGHSLGGLVVGRYAEAFAPEGLRGVIFVAPYVDVDMEVPGWKRRLGALADRISPALTMDNGLNVTELFRREADRVAYTDDPLVHRRISARLWGEMQRESGLLISDAPRLRVPVLLQLAGDDTVVSNAATREFASRLTQPEIKEYSEAYHALLHDTRASEVYADLGDWLANRLARLREQGDSIPLAAVPSRSERSNRGESTVEDR
jgi:alpha-beta hydrolase superfamily lysophospholipase